MLAWQRVRGRAMLKLRNLGILEHDEKSAKRAALSSANMKELHADPNSKIHKAKRNPGAQGTSASSSDDENADNDN